MRRTDLDDTSIEIHKLRIKLLREKGPEWRLQKTFELMDWSRSMFYEQTKRALSHPATQESRLPSEAESTRPSASPKGFPS